MRFSSTGKTLCWVLLTFYGIKLVAQEPVSIWSGIYTENQAIRGEEIYTEECADCHREDLRGQDMSPSLVGIGFTFKWEGKNLQEFYASMRFGMPQTAPGSLMDSQYVALTAFLLSRNGFPAGDLELTADQEQLENITITSSR